MRHRSFPIRWHLAIYGFLIVCPLLIVGVLVSKRYADMERRNLQRTAQTLVREVTDAIDQEIERHKAVLLALSTSENLAAGNIEGFYRRAKQVTDALSDATISLRNAAGNQIFVTSLPFGAPLLPTQQVHQATHRRAIETRAAVVSDLFRGRLTGGNYIFVQQPVEKDGEVAYLLSITISPSRFLSILKTHLGDSGWLVGVTDTRGRIIARSWDHDRYVGQSASQGFLENTTGDAGIFTSTSLDGITLFNHYVRSSLTGWRVAAGIPISILEAPLYRSLTVLAIMVGIGLASSIILAILYAHFLAEPVSALRRVALSVGRQQPVPVLRTGIAELDGVSASLADASASLKQRDQLQESLINELNHRVKNTLATIQSIALQTRRRSGSLDEFGAAFEGRLLALAKSHDALTRGGWRGGDLRHIVLESCRPFGDESRTVVQGPPVELPAKAIVGLGMVLHELATNAAKYGAFATSSGTVSIKWRIDGNDGQDVLHVRWKERGGPPVVPSDKKGFGSILIVSIIESDLGGKAESVFEPDGLRFEASIPLKTPAALPSFLANNGSAPPIAPEPQDTKVPG